MEVSVENNWRLAEERDERGDEISVVKIERVQNRSIKSSNSGIFILWLLIRQEGEFLYFLSCITLSTYQFGIDSIISLLWTPFYNSGSI